MKPSLDGPRAKVERAEEHFRNLNSELLGLQRLNPYSVVVEPEPDARERVIRVRGSYAFPLRWGAIVGDAVHNLRAALDLLVWQLVLAGGKRPDKKTEFPIFLDAAKFKAGSPRKVKGASEVAVDIINGLQPYRETQWPERHPLWILHSLDIRDKHQLLNIVMCAANTQRIEVSTAGNYGIVGSQYCAFVKPVEDGAELGRFLLKHADIEVNVKTNVAFDVIFEDVGLGYDLAVLPAIKMVGEFVENTIELFADHFD